MKISDRNYPDRFFPGATLIFVFIFACFSVWGFLAISRRSMNSLFDRSESQYRQNLINIVSVARNALEPVLTKVHSGEVGREEAIQQVRTRIRNMTYTDQYGRNYVFMSSYDGMMLVQPFEPERELTNQWDLQDPNGLYIIRELVKAAQTHPNGSFVQYDYYLPGVYSMQKKLAYVVGLPEIGCYIGTGMYMERAIQEQREILTNVEYLSLWLLVAVLSPISVSIFVILKKNRLLLAEVAVRKKAEEDLKKGEEKYRSIFENAMGGIYQTSVDGRLIDVNPALPVPTDTGLPGRCSRTSPVSIDSMRILAIGKDCFGPSVKRGLWKTMYSG